MVFSRDSCKIIKTNEMNQLMVVIVSQKCALLGHKGSTTTISMTRTPNKIDIMVSFMDFDQVIQMYIAYYQSLQNS